MRNDFLSNWDCTDFGGLCPALFKNRESGVREDSALWIHRRHPQSGCRRLPPRDPRKEDVDGSCKKAQNHQVVVALPPLHAPSTEEAYLLLNECDDEHPQWEQGEYKLDEVAARCLHPPVFHRVEIDSQKDLDDDVPHNQQVPDSLEVHPNAGERDAEWEA